MNLEFTTDALMDSSASLKWPLSTTGLTLINKAVKERENPKDW